MQGKEYLSLISPFASPNIAADPALIQAFGGFASVLIALPIAIVASTLDSMISLLLFFVDRQLTDLPTRLIIAVLPSRILTQLLKCFASQLIQFMSPQVIVLPLVSTDVCVWFPFCKWFMMDHPSKPVPAAIIILLVIFYSFTSAFLFCVLLCF